VRSPSRVAFPLVGLAIALGPGGCEASSIPPLEVEAHDASSDAGGGPMFGDASLMEPSCTVGVEGGVCDCTDQPLAVDPPTLYFVLDRSGSMGGVSPPATSGPSKWDVVQTVLKDLAVGLGPRAKYAVAVFPDPKLDDCNPGREVFPPIQGDAPPGTEGLNELAIFSTLQKILPSGGTPTAATLQALTSRITSLPGKVYVIFATDGGPNCDANAVCDASMCTLNIESQPGCVPSGPSCCDEQGGALACLDAQPSIDAVTAIAQAGVPVYVLGVPQSEPYAGLLDQLAIAGGTARGSEPQYYAVTDQGSFEMALSQVAAKITGTCTLTLDAPPPDARLVNVFFDAKPVPQAGADGWTLDGATVTLLGASCQQVLTGGVLDVRVVAGCPTVTL
jgi:hypothetical protein